MEKTMKEALDGCLFFSVKKLDRILDKIADECFQKTGLTPSYGFILLLLNEEDGLTQKKIAEMLSLAPSTLTRFIEKLKNKNFINTEIIGRQSLVYLTEEGRQIVPVIQQSWDELHENYEKILGADFSQQITQSLNEATHLLKK